MKKQMKLLTCLTKPLVLFVLLFALGVGQMWAGTKRIYFDYSLVTMWSDYTNLSGGVGFACVHCWGGKEGDADYTMSVVEGETYLACCDIDEGWTNVCFYRKGSDGSWWTKTFDYNSFGSKNYFKIKNESEKDSGIDKYKWDSATRWAPGVCIDGLIDVNNPHLQPFTFDDNDGTYEVTLSAHTTYQFCILDGSTRYTVDNNVWSGTIPGYTLGTSGYDIRLATAGAGTYKFEYNKSTHVMKVTYPTVNHPNIDYCYLYKFNDWTHHYLHIYDSESSIEGTTYPGTEIENYFEIGDDKYYYFAPGDYANCQPNDNNDSRKVNPAASTSAGLGKFQKYITDSWGWRTFTVRVQLNDLTPTTHVDPTYMDVAFNSAVLTDLTTVPTKTHYDFGGFYTGYDAENDVAIGTQVIDEEGHWIASVSDEDGVPFTDASKHWIHPGTSTTLYAKWTEHEYALTINVSPNGAGTVSPAPSVVKLVTPTALLTATPSHGAWIFKEWQYSTNLGPYGKTGNDNTVQVTASQDATLTAVFEPRFCLVGEIYNGGGATGGMPGWTTYTEDFTVNRTSPSVNLTCVRKLDPNTTFRFNVHDKKTNKNLGHSPAGEYISDNSWEFANQDYDVLLRATGHGDYTFTISAIRQDGDNYYPTVSVSGPTSHLVNIKWADVDIDGNWWKTSRSTGGTVAAVATESGDTHPISDGQYVAQGGSITYTATPASGYRFGGWWNTNWGYKFSDDSLYTSSSISTTQNFEAKFEENSTTVTLSNDGHGHVEINDETVSRTTVGITTHRELTAEPDDGYYFTGWTKTECTDYDISSTSAASTTLSGLGTGASSGQTLTANFALRYSVKGTMNSENWGTDHFISNIEKVGGKAIGYVDISLPANTSYEFAIYDFATKGWLKNNTDRVFYMTNGNSYNWGFDTDKTQNCGITTAGAGTYRFIWNITDKKMSVVYPNFVIYRSGDKDDDPRAALDDVESYEGGTISEAIEFRMKVRELDKWYSLSLPFTVNAVKVWDDEDGEYYDIVPYYRATVDGTLQGGHYIIRTPKTATNLSIAEFDDWYDPTSASEKPSANTPYIIQWHMGYFANKYISFFSPTGQEIPDAMTVGNAPSSDNVVNVYGNDAMVSGSVAGAYLLENDYGSDGAWIRSENVSESRTILPFECYIRANDPTTTKYRILHRDMDINGTTGWEDVINSETQAQITVYTMSGFRVTQFNNCSFDQAARQLRSSFNEGLYILRADNESVKVMLGGK